jgi:hypothetical protein
MMNWKGFRRGLSWPVIAAIRHSPREIEGNYDYSLVIAEI